MGKRGPGAGRLRAAAKEAPIVVSHPWDKDGMPEAERVIAFLESLPIVSGLRAGEKLELLEFQRQFVRGEMQQGVIDGDATGDQTRQHALNCRAIAAERVHRQGPQRE